ncbi:MAG: hypothetical protein FWB75_08175 [Oscillospiraceae bacterium]|nr:hypothetical protein [Oscillospiraceae bacterium]
MENSYDTLLKSISDKYSEILGDNLAGIYVHGSIAFNCFSWASSDIDFIVVVFQKISTDDKLALLRILHSLRGLALENYSSSQPLYLTDEARIAFCEYALEYICI